MLLFIAIVLSIPLYAYCIWGLYRPDEAIVFLDKWRYDEPPKFSESQMMFFRFSNILGIGLITILILVAALIAGEYSWIL